MADDAIRCDACPVLCYIALRTGSCDRYGNHIPTVRPSSTSCSRAQSRGESLVPFLGKSCEWDGTIVSDAETFVTAIGAGTTHPIKQAGPIHYFV